MNRAPSRDTGLPTGQSMLRQEVFTLADGTQIATLVGGPANAAPIVLLHGGGTDHAMLSWRDTLPALRDAGYRVYAPSYPGYGDSPPDDRASTINGLIRYLEELMDVWRLEKATLVGISMGGALAIGYTLAHPGRVARLVLVGSYGIQDQAPYHFWSYLFVRVPWVSNAMWAMMRNSRSLARYTLNSIIRNPQSRTDALVDEVLEAIKNPHSQRMFSQFQRDEICRDGIKTNYTERLPEISQPVLIVHGTHDTGVPLAYAQRAASRFQNARFEIFENAGHWTQRDYPQRFNQLLLEFLQDEGETRAPKPT